MSGTNYFNFVGSITAFFQSLRVANGACRRFVDKQITLIAMLKANKTNSTASYPMTLETSHIGIGNGQRLSCFYLIQTTESGTS
jgi:hypothetical protein